TLDTLKANGQVSLAYYYHAASSTYARLSGPLLLEGTLAHRPQPSMRSRGMKPSEKVSPHRRAPLTYLRSPRTVMTRERRSELSPVRRSAMSSSSMPAIGTGALPSTASWG